MKRCLYAWYKAMAVMLLSAVLMAAAGSAGAFWSGKAEETAGDSGAPAAMAGEVTGYEGVICIGFFKTEGGEEAEYSVMSEPRHGTVEVEGRSFCYTPDPGRTGKDSFTYTATDADGRVSAPATVEVNILKRTSGTIYNDMTRHPYHTAAVHLAEKGVFVGEKIGGEYFFRPEETVSRSEFLAMAMEALQVKSLEETAVTGFCDDDEIPQWAKGYAAAALKCGAICGVPTGEGIAFDAASPVTFSTAAAILNRMLELPDVENSYESWAGQAAANLEAVSVMAVGSFGPQALSQTMNRGEVVQLISAAMDFAQKEEESQSVFSRWF